MVLHQITIGWLTDPRQQRFVIYGKVSGVVPRYGQIRKVNVAAAFHVNNYLGRCQRYIVKIIVGVVLLVIM